MCQRHDKERVRSCRVGSRELERRGRRTSEVSPIEVVGKKGEESRNEFKVEPSNFGFRDGRGHREWWRVSIEEIKKRLQEVVL